MKGYKEPGFADRAAASARAKTSALEKLKDAPKPDEAVLAAKAARQAERDVRAAERRAAALEAKEAKLRELEQARLAAAEQAEPEVSAPSEEDRKAARDARYAARKKRKS